MRPAGAAAAATMAGSVHEAVSFLCSHKLCTGESGRPAAAARRRAAALQAGPKAAAATKGFLPSGPRSKGQGIDDEVRAGGQALPGRPG